MAKDKCSTCGNEVKRTSASREQIICQPCRRKGKYLPLMTCVLCGVLIKTKRYWGRKYCSPACAQLDLYGHTDVDPIENKRERYRRKNRLRRLRLSYQTVGYYTLNEVAARDNYVCSSCLKPVDMPLSGMDPMGPTIDHIIPISRGGLDSTDNVALTHRICNTRKRDRYGVSSNSRGEV